MRRLVTKVMVVCLLVMGALWVDANAQCWNCEEFIDECEIFCQDNGGVYSMHCEIDHQNDCAIGECWCYD